MRRASGWVAVVAKQKRIWREHQHPRDAHGRFARRGGTAWVQRAGEAIRAAAGDAGDVTRADGRPRISRNAKAGVTLQAHTDGGRPSPVRVPKAVVTPSARPVDVSGFNAADAAAIVSAPVPSAPKKRIPRPSPGAAALIAARAAEQAPHVPAMVAARTAPEEAPVAGAGAYANMKRHTLIALARDAKINVRGKSNTEIANALAAHDQKVKADRKAKLNPSGVGKPDDAGSNAAFQRAHKAILNLNLDRTAQSGDTPRPEELARLNEGTLQNMAKSAPGSPLSKAAQAELDRRNPSVDTPRDTSNNGGMTSTTRTPTTNRRQIPRNTKAAVMTRDGAAVDGVDMTDPQRWSRSDAKYRFAEAAQRESYGFGDQSTLTDDERNAMRDAVTAFQAVPSWETQRMDAAARRIQRFRDLDKQRKADFTASRQRMAEAARAVGSVDREEAAKEHVKQLKKQHKIPGDATLKKMPAGQRRLAESIIFDAKNAARVRANAENSQRNAKIIRAELARDDLNPRTRAEVEKLLRSIEGGATIEGADRMDAAINARLDVWNAVRTAAAEGGEPGKGDYNYEVMPGNGLSREQADALMFLGREDGPALADRAAAVLNGRGKAPKADAAPVAAPVAKPGRAARIEATLRALPAGFEPDEQTRRQYVTESKGTWHVGMEGHPYYLQDMKSKREALQWIVDAQASRERLRNDPAHRADTTPYGKYGSLSRADFDGLPPARQREIAAELAVSRNGQRNGGNDGGASLLMGKLGLAPTPAEVQAGRVTAHPSAIRAARGAGASRITPDAKRGALASARQADTDAKRVDTSRDSSHNGGMTTDNVAARATEIGAGRGDRVAASGRRPAAPGAGTGETTLGVTESSRGRTTTVTLPDGSTAQRTSKTMEYSHAVVATTDNHAEAVSMRATADRHDAFADALEAWIANGSDMSQLRRIPTGSGSVAMDRAGIRTFGYYLPGFEPTIRTGRSGARWAENRPGSTAVETRDINRDGTMVPLKDWQEEYHGPAAHQGTLRDSRESATSLREKAAGLDAGPQYSYSVDRWSQRPDSAHAAIGSPELSRRNTRYDVVGVGGVAQAPTKPVKSLPTPAEKEAAKEAAKVAEKARKEASDAKFLADRTAAVNQAIDNGADPEEQVKHLTDAALRYLSTKLKAKLPKSAAERTPAVRRKAIVEAIRAQRSAEGKA